MNGLDAGWLPSHTQAHAMRAYIDFICFEYKPTEWATAKNKHKENEKKIKIKNSALA